MSQGVFNETSPIVSVPDPRILLLFLLDVSGTMIGEPIRNLNKSINEFKEQVCADPRVANILDVAIVAFNHETHVVMPFTPAVRMEPVNLTASGGTEIEPAVQVALDMVEEQVRSYQYAGIRLYQPWICMISDGWGGDVSAVAERVRRKEKEGRLKFFALGVEGYDSKTLHQLCGETVLKLEGYDFAEFFDWVFRGVRPAVFPVEPGERLQLPRLPDGVSLEVSDWWLD